MNEAPNAKWMDTLSQEVFGDPHVSGKWGFRVWMLDEREPFEWESGLVYSSREDAEQAADDAAHVAWRFRNW